MTYTFNSLIDETTFNFFGLISHLCPGLHTITNFTILRRKIAAATIFRGLRFSVTSSFSHLPEGVLNYTNSAKLEKNGDHDDSLQFTFSCSLLVCLASQTALPNLTNSAKMAKRLVTLYDFSSLLYRSHLREGASELN